MVERLEIERGGREVTRVRVWNGKRMSGGAERLPDGDPLFDELVGVQVREGAVVGGEAEERRERRVRGKENERVLLRKRGSMAMVGGKGGTWQEGREGKGGGRGSASKRECRVLGKASRERECPSNRRTFPSHGSGATQAERREGLC